MSGKGLLEDIFKKQGCKQHYKDACKLSLVGPSSYHLVPDYLLCYPHFMQACLFGTKGVTLV